MTLHIFNPEHDIALASNLSNFTSPRAGRELRRDLSFLPALWASEGDWVLCDDPDDARCRLEALSLSVKNVRFLSREQLASAYRHGLPCDFAIDPWGWDLSIRRELTRCGIPENLMPTAMQIDNLREMSHRNWATLNLLPHLFNIYARARTFSVLATSVEHVRELQQEFGRCVLKAPWSSSGRGVRFITDERQLASLCGWIKSTIEQQRGIMVEPYHEKLADFAMEFRSTEDGIEYLGLSVFNTTGSTYTGNMIASEEEKLSFLESIYQSYCEKKAASLSSEPISATFNSIRNSIAKCLFPVFSSSYRGSFGIDMMLIATPSGVAVHPCVELNIRHTMGEAALHLAKDTSLHGRNMKIVHDGHYKLAIE